MLSPAVEPPRRRGVLLLGAVLGASLVGMIVLALPAPAPAPVTNVDVAPAAPVIVQVPVPLPVPAPPAPPPAPPPAAPEPDPPPPPRATAPFLDARCIGSADGCTWDAGFPAISHDGKTVVLQRAEEDAGRGHPNLYIDFVDAATSKVTRTIRILDPDEYDGEHVPVAKVERRVAAAQRAIDAIGFRSLVRVPLDDFEPAHTTLRAEVDGDAIRVIDRASSTVVWRARFPGRAAFPNLPAEDPAEDPMCNHPEASTISAAWDAETRTMVATVGYVFGGCLCGGAWKTYVRRVSAPR